MPQVKPAPAPESLLGLDGDDETLSERGSVGSGSGPSTPDARGGKEASSSTPSASGSKRKRESLSCDRVEADGPEPTRSGSSDTTWSMDSLHDGCPRSLSRKKNGRSEHSVTSAALISRPRGVLKLRKLPQNVSAETGAGGCNVLQPNGISKPAHFMRRKRIRKPRALKENRVGGDDPVSCLKTENGTHDQDITTKSCSENDLSVPKLPGEPSKPVHVDKDSAGHAQGHIDVSLEENAAMMLCSLSDNRHDDPLRNRMSSPDRSSKESNLHRSNRLNNPYKNEDDVAGPSRLLRKRDGKGPFRKRRPRRHFYEVSPHDLDPFSIVKERIRVFWPLDETWYFGLVKKYDPVTKRHHVKYDDKDEEWINLQNERIKLLLLPGEGRRRCINNTSRKARKVNYEGEKRVHMDQNGSGSESEPIISWLAQSNQARSGTSSSISKTVLGHPNFPVLSKSFDANPGFFGSDGAIPGGLHANGGPEVHNDVTVPRERRFRFVYYRRRFRRRRNGFVNISEHDSHLKRRSSSAVVLASANSREADTETGAPVEYVILVLSLPLKSVCKLISEACSVWLPSTFLHPQHGSLITLWPAVCLDILLVDGTLGLKHLLLETCLRSAVFLFCSLVGSFNQDSGLNAFDESEAPCTSVRFQISGLHGRSQSVFVLFSLIGIGKTQWKNLHAKFRYHSLKRELSNVDCTYADIKQLISGNGQNVRTSMNLFSKVQNSPYLCRFN
uniref:Tudor domain-containing protein n=1 Tax=Aegilops tauschii subsp. strangulata TaxID=200361 RepID=A0A453E926_AEGTS